MNKVCRWAVHFCFLLYDFIFFIIISINSARNYELIGFLIKL